MANEVVTIAEIQGLLTAEVLKSKLEAAGIPVLLQYETAGVVFGLTVDGLGRVLLQVPAEREEEALAIISEEAGDPADGEAPPEE